MAEPEQKLNSRGYVVLKHKDGFVQEFVPESVPSWLELGWSVANEKDIEKAADQPGAEVDLGAAQVAPTTEEN